MDADLYSHQFHLLLSVWDPLDHELLQSWESSMLHCKWQVNQDLDDFRLQKGQAVTCEKARAIMPLSTSPLSLAVRTRGEKVLAGIQYYAFLGKPVMPISKCGHTPYAKPWRTLSFVSSFSTLLLVVF